MTPVPAGEPGGAEVALGMTGNLDESLALVTPAATERTQVQDASMSHRAGVGDLPGVPWTSLIQTVSPQWVAQGNVMAGSSAMHTWLSWRARRGTAASHDQRPGFDYCFSSWPGRPVVTVELSNDYNESSERSVVVSSDDRNVLYSLREARTALGGGVSVAACVRGAL